MSEDDARLWIESRFAPDRCAKLSSYIELLADGMKHQNLISRNSFDQIWSRHLLDSAQLITPAERWCDIGSGAGLPGVVIGILSDAQVTLVEPRKLRAAFLLDVVQNLDLSDRVDVIPLRVERVEASCYDVISARAVASLSNLFDMASHLADECTRWILPRGRSFSSEIEDAEGAWSGMFHVKQSLADPSAAIVTVTGVSRR